MNHIAKRYMFFCIVECSKGYIGVNCEKPCPFPHFGNFCQNTCECTQDQCDVAEGCVQQRSIGNSNLVM